MPVAYESDGGTNASASNSNAAVAIPLPAVRPVGSVLLFIGWCRLITGAVSTAPSGYTLLGTFTSGTANGGVIWVYAKQVVGGETDPTFAVNNAVTGASGDLWGADIFCYSGVDLSGGIAAILDGTPTTTDASGTTTCTYPALTITNADSMIVRFLARFRDAVDTFTPTATWNEREDFGSTTRLGGQFHLQDKLATASGVQASVDVAPSNTTATRYLAVSLALKAAVTTVDVTVTATAAGLILGGVPAVSAGYTPPACPPDPICGTHLCGEAICGAWFACVPSPALLLGGRLPSVFVASADEVPQAGLILGAFVPVAAGQIYLVPQAGLKLGAEIPNVTIGTTLVAPQAGLVLGGVIPAFVISTTLAITPAGLLLGAWPPSFAGQILLLPTSCVDVTLSPSVEEDLVLVGEVCTDLVLEPAKGL